MNTLYPIFLKPSKLKLLIVGGGLAGYEKLFFILKNSPEIKIEMVAKDFCDDLIELINKNKDSVSFRKKEFKKDDLNGKNLVIVAANDEKLNTNIEFWANEMNILVNVADTPEKCDFYLGSIVTRGDLKIAISTNGKSPTFAKRFREVLEDILPNSTNSLINNLNQIRNELTVDFTQKVEKLNEVTSSLLRNK